MTSSSKPASNSTELVLYDPTLPHISMKAHLEAITDNAARRSMELAKFETLHLSPLEQKWKERIVTRMAQGLSHLYIDQEVGQKMANIIIRNLKKGDYDSASNPFTFKQQIFDDLRAVCPDKHLTMFCSEHPIPEYDPDRSLKTLEDDEMTVQQKEYLHALYGGNSDFSQQVNSHMIPDTQIGYFKINAFPDPNAQGTKAIIDAAMQRVVNAEALIIDLRDNGGGSPGTVAFLASYLFDERQLINQIYRREDNRTTSYYAEPEKLSHRFGGQKPIYVLTSETTFSAGEEFAYDLQASGRAYVIGQVTAGGAHPVRAFVVDDHVYAAIPYEKAVNPYTGTNWEGKGVVPDIQITGDGDALERAKVLCKKKEEL